MFLLFTGESALLSIPLCKVCFGRVLIFDKLLTFECFKHMKSFFFSSDNFICIFYIGLMKDPNAVRAKSILISNFFNPVFSFVTWYN